MRTLIHDWWRDRFSLNQRWRGLSFVRIDLVL